MDFRLMQQINNGHSKFTTSPKLTGFPIGTNITPGLIANSLYQIYTPVYGEKSPNISTKEVKEIDQEGSGVEDVSSNSSISGGSKRKLEDDIFQKMLHPTFKVGKLEPKMKKVKLSPGLKSGNGSSTTVMATEKEKKYYKF